MNTTNSREQWDATAIVSDLGAPATAADRHEVQPASLQEGRTHCRSRAESRTWIASICRDTLSFYPHGACHFHSRGLGDRVRRRGNGKQGREDSLTARQRAVVEKVTKMKKKNRHRLHPPPVYLRRPDE
jgi:hypothetical protein